MNAKYASGHHHKLTLMENQSSQEFTEDGVCRHPEGVLTRETGAVIYVVYMLCSSTYTHNLKLSLHEVQLIT